MKHVILHTGFKGGQVAGFLQTGLQAMGTEGADGDHQETVDCGDD